MGKTSKPAQRIIQKKRRHEAYATDPIYRPYALAVGQLALAWNDLHESLGTLFATVVGDVTGEQMLAVWHTPKADRPKREMLAAAARNLSQHVRRVKPIAATELDWLLKEVEKFEDFRNNAVHAPLRLISERESFFTAQQEGVAPNDLTGNPRALRLAQKNVLEEFRWCRDVIMLLRDYAEAIDQDFWHETRRWPFRPRLPTRQMKVIRKNLKPMKDDAARSEVDT